MNDIEGFYKFTYTATPVIPGVYLFTVSYGVLCKGRFQAIDPGGFRWSGTYRDLGSDVEFDLVITATDADPNTGLVTPQGQQTRSPISYHAKLRKQIVRDKLTLDGQVPHGVITFDVAAQRLRGLDG